jgi:ADP-ribosylglycohydrolase
MLCDRYRGALLGLAVGDALGTTLEFKAPGAFKPITDMIGGGPFGLEPGQWTDDTSMALCLAESLIEKRGFDPKHQMGRYCCWWQEGYLSSTGTCFDIGAAGESARLTHAAPVAVAACRYFAGLLLGALDGRSKEQLLSSFFYPGFDRDYWHRHPLPAEIAGIANGSFKLKEPPEITGSGFVVRSLEAALWAFHHSDSFREGAHAVNLGDDADTTGAIYGQLAGTYYGVNAIPQDWIERLALCELISEMAAALFDFSNA